MCVCVKNKLRNVSSCEPIVCLFLFYIFFVSSLSLTVDKPNQNKGKTVASMRAPWLGGM